MNILCLLGHHHWKFGYNHGIPLGSNLSYEVVGAMFQDGRAYSIDVCTSCGRQSRMVDGKRVMLSRNEMENP